MTYVLNKCENIGAIERIGLRGHVYVQKGSGNFGPPPDVWQTLDVTTLGIPKNVAAVVLEGILVITGGTNHAGSTEIRVAFRRPGDAGITIRNHYQVQAAVNGTGGSFRGNASVTVTPVNGKFEWGYYHAPEVLGWPLLPSIAVNLEIARWYK